MFRVYKPKNLFRLRAVQVTEKTLPEITSNLMGRVALSETDAENGSPKVLGVDVPTFEGVKRFEVGTWIIKSEDNSLGKMSNDEFEKTYEVAVKRDSSQ